MWRKLGHLAAALSLLLCVCVAWVRGRRSTDWLHWTQLRGHEWRRETLVAGRDGFYGSHQWFFFDDVGYARKYAEGVGGTSGLSHGAMGESQKNPYSETAWNRLGFGLVRGTLQTDRVSDGSYRYVFSHGHVPYWFVLLVLSVPCWFWLARAFAG
jgi:hypothetical protein